MTSAMSGIRVVDLTGGIAGAVATMMMADFGADVLAIEWADRPDRRANPGFAMWDRGKRSLVLDPASDADRTVLADLLAAADVCVVSEAESEAEAVDGHPPCPRLVTLRLIPVIGDVAWAGGAESDGLLSAAMGLARRQSSFDGGPVDPVAPQALYMQGLWGAACAVAALVERESSGFGQSVVVSGSHGAAVASNATLVIDPAAAVGAPPSGPGGPSPFYSRYECGDGSWLFMGALIPKFQYRALEALDLSGLLQDARLADGLGAPMPRETATWLRAAIAEVFLSGPRQTWLDALDRVDCPSGPLLDRDLWLDHQQIVSNGLRAEVEDPARGAVVMPGLPLNLTGSPGWAGAPAPLRDDARPGLGGWSAQSAPSGDAPSARGPLAGIRVLDLGAILAGPLAGALLADLGADVIKVEPPEGDAFRVTGFMHNRGMRSLSIDLRAEDGRAAFHDLVRGADVVIDNYRAGVLERLRIDHASLAAVNPRIITLSVTGFGKSGPLVAKPGFDPVLQAMSGMMGAQGGDSEPVLLTLAINDVTAAAMSAFGAALAVLHRLRTGAGQHVWTSLLGTSTFMQSGELVRYAGRPGAQRGGRDFAGPSALDRYYAAADGWVRLQASPADVVALRAIGLIGAAGDDPDACEAALAKGFAERTVADAVAALTAAGVPAAPARTIADLADDAALRDAGLLHEHRLAGGGPYFTAGRYAMLARTDEPRVPVAPGMGEHTREILREAGLPAERIDALVEAGVVVQGGPMQLTGFASYR